MWTFYHRIQCFTPIFLPNIDHCLQWEAIQNDNPDVKVFTDSSGMEGKIGMEAVICIQRWKTQNQTMIPAGITITSYSIWGRRYRCCAGDQTNFQWVEYVVSHHLYWQLSFYCSHTTNQTQPRSLHFWHTTWKHHLTTEKTSWHRNKNKMGTRAQWGGRQWVHCWRSKESNCRGKQKCEETTKTPQENTAT